MSGVVSPECFQPLLEAVLRFAKELADICETDAPVVVGIVNDTNLLERRKDVMRQVGELSKQDRGLQAVVEAALAAVKSPAE
jgi:hypothetical protein